MRRRRLRHSLGLSVWPERTALRRRPKHAAANEGLCFTGEAVPLPGPALTELTRLAARGLPAAGSPPADGEEWKTMRPLLADRVRAVLGRFPERGPLKTAFFNHRQLGGILAERVVFESESGIHVPALFLTPEVWQGYVPAVIYVDEWGKDNGIQNGVIEALLQAGMAVFAIDVRGTGETSASDFEASTNALMTDRPLLGQRVFDVLRAVDALWERIFIGVQIDKGRIGCLGRGAGGLLALLAAALDERLLCTAVWEAPSTFHALIGETTHFPASVFLFDVLNHFDLPQAMALVAPRPLLLVNSVDGKRAPQPSLPESGLCSWPRQVYRAFGAENAFLQADRLAGRGVLHELIAAFFRDRFSHSDSN